MSMKKTLGGDRLGSGNKMQVELHGYERSTFDMGYLWRSTMSAGTLVPFMCEVALPGDTFDINLGCEILTHPTKGPLFGSAKVQLDTFQCPIRLYNALLHNNALNIGKQMSKVKLPQIELTADAVGSDVTDIDNAQINPSSLLAYLGIRGVGTLAAGTQTRQFNATAILAYWEIYKQYYANKQEEVGAVVHTPGEALVETVEFVQYSVPEAPAEGLAYVTPSTNLVITFSGATPIPSQIMINTIEHGWINLGNLGNFTASDATNLEATYENNQYGTIRITQWRYASAADYTSNMPKVQLFPLEDIDEMRNALLAYQSTTAPFVLNDYPDIAPYKWLFGRSSARNNVLNSQEGLAIKTYQSDIFNNWLSTEWIDGPNGINEISAVDVSEGVLKIDALNLSKKVYDMLNRIAVSGGTYQDWLDAVYTHDRYMHAETPIYHGGLTKELVFQEVVSNNATSTDANGSQPIGTLAGRGRLSNKHKGGSVVIKVDEPSYIIGLISITPRIDYSQGNRWDTGLKTIDDLHKPALDQIGFQDLIIENFAWWDTRHNGTEWVQHAVGKQPAWIDYMTNYNRVFGNFAIPDNEGFMVFNRRYEYDGTTVKDLTTYIDPAKFNFIFAQTSRDAQNYWAQISVDMIARRKMSSKVMPNL